MYGEPVRPATPLSRDAATASDTSFATSAVALVTFLVAHRAPSGRPRAVSAPSGVNAARDVKKGPLLAVELLQAGQRLPQGALEAGPGARVHSRWWRPST